MSKLIEELSRERSGSKYDSNVVLDVYPDEVGQSVSLDFERLAGPVRVVKLMEPLIRLKTNAFMAKDPELFKSVDLHAAALGVFDQVLRAMDFTRGATYDDLLTFANNIFLHMRSELTDSELQTLSDFLIQGLTNHADGLQSFKIPAWDSCKQEMGTLMFRYLSHDMMLKEGMATQTSEVRFHLTKEGALLYFTGMEAEDKIGTQIDQLKVRLLFERGDSQRAGLYARRMIDRSRFLESQLQEKRRQMRRNSHSTSFRNDLLPYLSESRELFGQIIDADSALFDTINEKLESASDDDYKPMKQLLDILRNVNQRHAELFNRVDEATDEYGELISRPIRLSSSLHFQVNLERDVLEPLLKGKLSLDQLNGELGEKLANEFLLWVDNSWFKLFSPFDYCAKTEQRFLDQEDVESSRVVDEEIEEAGKPLASRVGEEAHAIIEMRMFEMMPRVGDYITLSDLIDDFADNPTLAESCQDPHFAIHCTAHQGFAKEYNSKAEADDAYDKSALPTCFGFYPFGKLKDDAQHSGSDFHIVRIKE
ncbi:hypothetical protein [Vibrio neptunius]|uniref:Uncharacterized protein n=1 Tax=Vibrio neptunius TaxID=170651 RepID=A0ABS3A1Y8_9VIBR|nr:hypothetical protein [Vibrio neptunius]MBN3493784.1 hypothetical protein [Vibrio neptunius]MBN3516280.1 hypothetical protein [Vibrio neptunius]MBN3550225.1 hypothetical protein [Vibrio neptunius]MBN3578511.1 hypothetical protein [Vibrio neptunius]MCH9872176.1 hypothetical protein [Vibrio neptunius]